MIETTVLLPWYLHAAFAIVVFILLVGLLVFLVKKEVWLGDGAILAVISFFFAGMLSIGFAFITSETVVYNNPIEAKNSGNYVNNETFDETALKEKIIQETNIDQLTFQDYEEFGVFVNKSHEAVLLETLSQGDLVHFEGVQEGKKIEGLYFTSDSLNILISDTEDEQTQETITIKTY